jgi:phage tail sheath protein FI
MSQSTRFDTPGVHIEEAFAAPEPAFATGVPIFVGYAAAGPIDEPIMVYLWSDFVSRYGAAAAITGTTGSALAGAVHGYFENGGRLCYVVRQAPPPAPQPDGLRSALAASLAVESADLLCAPDVTLRWSERSSDEHLAQVVTLQREIVDHCAGLGTRVALLDSLDPVLGGTEQIVRQRQALIDGLGAVNPLRDSFGALYHPWLVPAGDSRPLPPCGHVAGTIAAGDEQVGVHKPPANEPLAAVVGLAGTVGAADQRRLWAENVNVIRALPGRGIRVWGARTLSPDRRWQALSTRRVLVTVARWTERYLGDLAFEPHSPELWLRVMREVSGLLDDLYHQGALKGPTADHAYYVKCDADTNPPEVRDRGLLVTDIGMATSVPAELLDVRIIQGAGGTTITSQQAGAAPSATAGVTGQAGTTTTLTE